MAIGGITLSVPVVVQLTAGIEAMSNTFFTSDTHFGHGNINKYSNRPYRDVHEMDDSLIANINRHVQSGDTLYHLGDWSFGYDSDRHVEKYRDRINCNNIILIYGNHDKTIRKNRWNEKRLFKSIHELLEIKIDNQDIVLCHYSMRVWNKSHHQSWHLYGHSHGSLPNDISSLSFDVGVDCCDYIPLSLDGVRQRMATKAYKPIDHHGRRDFETQKLATVKRY